MNKQQFYIPPDLEEPLPFHRYHLGQATLTPWATTSGPGSPLLPWAASKFFQREVRGTFVRYKPGAFLPLLKFLYCTENKTQTPWFHDMTSAHSYLVLYNLIFSIPWELWPSFCIWNMFGLCIPYGYHSCGYLAQCVVPPGLCKAGFF